ncbi:sensor histidine kinase [Microbacterium sp. cf046]|uniref:sensor histidine kinase n=1 Tax=Microbacterium sp. cf046 TaxID=1761803 RepID=UPI0020C857D4|nr:sensor histidine kinase [Microbacterium sp. cf046]
MTTEQIRTEAPTRTGWAAYGREWKLVPGRALYLILAFALAMTAVSVLAGLFWTGVGLLILIVGLPIIMLSLFVARGFGLADRYLLLLTGLPEIAEPEWDREVTRSEGFWATISRPLRNGHYWTYLLHGMIVSPIVSTVTFALTTVWLSVSLGGLTFWFWGAFIPRGDGTGEWGQYVSAAMPWLFGGWSSFTVEVTLYLIAGVIFAVTLPWVMSGLARFQYLIARGLLGRWASDDLAAEARAEAAARTSAVQAESAGLRRLERDIHDGPQQRLVRLQLDLAALERRAAAGDTEAAAELAREAQGHAKAALDELRALSSGVAPPLLQDRGLAAALAGVAAASALPVSLDIDPAVDAAVPAEVARTVYFVIAELITNAVKHAGASAATLKVSLRPGETPPMLDVWVVDNGRGGAHMVPGHGLEGLRDRIAGLRGVLVVDSPLGGPTAVGVHIPLASTIAAAPATA